MRQKLKATLILLVLICSVIALAFIEAGCYSRPVKKYCWPDYKVILAKYPEANNADWTSRQGLVQKCLEQDMQGCKDVINLAKRLNKPSPCACWSEEAPEKPYEWKIIHDRIPPG